MNQSFKKELSLLLAFSLVFILGIYILIFFTRRDIVARVQNINSFKLSLSENSLALNALGVLESDRMKTLKYGDFVNYFLPAKEGLLSFRREVFRVSTDKKIDAGFSWGEESDGGVGDLGSIGFEISLKFQQPQQLGSFLKEIQLGKYFVNIGSIKSSRDGSDFKASIFGSIFYKKDSLKVE
ncbi:MAG: hypothetical protein EXS49_01550 [Candidatus Pacebacteria bacterium]|nr:hypothetical protein [Candidatus Paceibacterota bacterium]